MEWVAESTERLFTSFDEASQDIVILLDWVEGAQNISWFGATESIISVCPPKTEVDWYVIPRIFHLKQQTPHFGNGNYH
jgi:hypothetical protein